VTSRKHAQELLPVLRQATAECDEVGAASRNQLHNTATNTATINAITTTTTTTTRLLLLLLLLLL